MWSRCERLLGRDSVMERGGKVHMYYSNLFLCFCSIGLKIINILHPI